MRRALQLAGNGEGRVAPNPMVGAVVVHDDRIIGEGFHNFHGGPHAEVNAINSVKEKDKKLLGNSTIYVTLEPCAHYGKTPPCANLIVKSGIPRVVIGTADPNPLVSGKGIKILEEAGVEVVCGVLEDECKELNRKFIKAQTTEYPWITLKWAQSTDGYMASIDKKGNLKPVKFSTPLSTVWVHRERAVHEAILVGGNTERIDRPSLTTRLWGGNSPQKFTAHFDKAIPEMLSEMRKDGITTLMVEGGASLLKYFILSDLYDEIRVETSPTRLEGGLKAPRVPYNAVLKEWYKVRNNLIEIYCKKA